jgi:hypothetical protein
MRAPRAPVLVRRGGEGSGQRWSQTLWLWRLPPEGKLYFVCEWPELNIGLSRVQIDSALFHEAVRRSQTLWDDAPYGSEC